LGGGVEMKEHGKSTKRDVFFKALLIAVAVLLTLNIMAYLVPGSPSYAAKKIEYKVFKYFSGKSRPSMQVQMQTVLEKAGSDGWDLVTLDVRNHLLVFKK
jgi:hypothetical protein